MIVVRTSLFGIKLLKFAWNANKLINGGTFATYGGELSGTLVKKPTVHFGFECLVTVAADRIDHQHAVNIEHRQCVQRASTDFRVRTSRLFRHKQGMRGQRIAVIEVGGLFHLQTTDRKDWWQAGTDQYQHNTQLIKHCLILVFWWWGQSWDAPDSLSCVCVWVGFSARNQIINHLDQQIVRLYMPRRWWISVTKKNRGGQIVWTWHSSSKIFAFQDILTSFRIIIRLSNNRLDFMSKL